MKSSQLDQTNTSTSYLLWLTCLFGISGIHRFYNKKPISGTLWLLTWGFFGIGQFIDLFLIPSMVEDHNLRQRDRLGVLPGGVMLSQPTVQMVAPRTTAQSPKPLKQDRMLKLLKAAQTRNGRLSVTQAVMDTELSFEEVEATLKEMVRTGYVSIENHAETGVILYHFVEL